METEQRNKIIITDRKRMVIEGVKKLLAFDDKEFQMETNLGFLIVQGTGLGLDGMDTDKQFLSIQGTINSLKYSSANPETKESILKRIFK